MKIIAQMDQTRFLAEVSKDEIAQIAGYGYASAFENKYQQIEVGKTVVVSKLWDALSASRERKDDITRLSVQLKQIASRLTSVNQALAEPIIEVK